MLTIDLEKKLIVSKVITLDKLNKQIKTEEALLENVKNLLEDDAKKDYETLHEVGFGNAIKNAESAKHNLVISKTRLSDLKSNRIFSEKEIKSLAIEYQLRFLPTEYYNGVLPSDLSQKLKEASEIIGSNIHADQRIYNSWNMDKRMKPYYILAPTSSFKLEKRPVDPLFFAKLKNGEYYLIHKWGNDLSIFRSKTLIISLMSLLSLPLLYFIVSFAKSHIENIVPVFIAILVVVLPLYFSGIFEYIEIWEINKENWNSKFKD